MDFDSTNISKISVLLSSLPQSVCYNTNMLIRAILAGTLFLLPLSPCVSYAQVGVDINNITGTGVTIDLEPQYPNPQDTVTATIDDYSMNTTGATISWYFDGLSVPTATNLRTITFTAPRVDTVMNIVARLTFPDGRTLESKRIIKPLYLDLIIEPQTYTPTFYQGRALPTKGSLVYINALLQTRNGPVDSSKYSYTWTLNTRSVYGGAKKGSSWAEITVPHGLANVITVAIQNNQGTTVARKLFTLPTVNMEVQFYELSTLLGLSTRAITEGVTLAGNSTSIKAIPYYLDTRAVNAYLFTQWSINNQKIQTENSDPFEINLSKGVAGNAVIGFKIRNVRELLQSDERTFNVTF